MNWHFSPKRLAMVVACFGVMAVASLEGASVAFAAETITGTHVLASGSSLQKAAQETWSKEFKNNEPFQEYILTALPSITYTSTSSGEGLEEFGNITGAFVETDPVAKAAGVLDGFVGTDDPPTEPQILNANSASGSLEDTVPVEQAPVAVIFSLPGGITPGAGTQIRLTNLLLSALWNGEVPASTNYKEQNLWGALLEDAGLKKTTGTPAANEFTDAGGATGGTQKIELAARSKSSGTTFTYRDYLFLLKLEGITNSYTEEKVTDSAEEGAKGWPVKVLETGNGTGGELAEKVEKTAGLVGYANLADAAKAKFLVLALLVTGTVHHFIVSGLIQNNGHSSTPTYAGPEKGIGGKLANVDVSEEILVHSKGTTKGKVGNWTDPETSDGSWAGSTILEDTYANDSLVGSQTTNKGYYPIVAVTYDLAWSDYTTSLLEASKVYNSKANAEAIGASVFGYLEYVLNSTTGQVANEENYYAPIPTAVKTSVEKFQLKLTTTGVNLGKI